MKRAALLLLLLVCPVWAGGVYTSGQITIDFKDGPCVEHMPKVLIESRTKAPSRAATVKHRGNILKACWAFDAEGDYIIIDERGDGGIIYARSVKPKPNL